MTLSQFPAVRMRRMRRDAFSRSLIRESHLHNTDLIQPVFLLDGSQQRQPVVSMPGVLRLSLDLVLDVAAECLELGIPAISLQPVIDTVLRTADGAEALNANGLLPRAIETIKETFPALGVMAEVGLSPYIAHGQEAAEFNNPASAAEKHARIVQQALMLAKAGADFLVLSADAQDGQIGAIRANLEAEGMVNTRIVAASANYSSAFYGPNGDHGEPLSPTSAVRKATPLTDPANVDEAMHEVALDLAEGADAVMVKPGMAYLDVLYRVKERYKVPTFAFQASGEYAMLKAAAQNGWLLHDRVMMEWAIAFKRAGADAIFTFFARDIARLLKQKN